MIRFISFRTGRVTKQCELPQDYGSPYWADVPGKGPVIEFKHLHWPPLQDESLDEISADEGIPCTESFAKAPLGNLRYATPTGDAGVGDFTMTDGCEVFADASGRIRKIFAKGSETDFNIKLPAEAVAEGNRRAWLNIGNPEIVLVTLAQGENRPACSFVLRRRDNRWTRLPEHLSTGFKRGFGPYIAITEAREKRAIASQLKSHPNYVDIDEAVRTDERSPGSNEWRTESGPAGPNLMESFAVSRSIFPGRLHVFDSNAGLTFVLTTNQADSEILLIADGTVYYRVSDRLYSAPLSAKGFGRSQLVAADPVLRDAHWAFITP